MNTRLIFGIMLMLMLLQGVVSATITYTPGTNLITLDDSVGAGDSWGTCYDEDDIVTDVGDALIAAKQGANAYDISARLKFLSGVYFCSSGTFVELKPNPINPVYTISADSGSHVRIGNYDSDYDYSYGGSYWKIYINSNTGTRLNRFDGELLVYGSNIWTDGASYVDSLNFWGTTRIFDTEMEGNAYISGTDINFQRVTWMGKHTEYDMLYASGYDYNWAGIKAMNARKGIFLSGTVSSPIDLYDVTVVDCTNSVYVSGNELMRLINSDFDRATTRVPYNRIGIQECYTYNVLVTHDNVPLVGALVTLKDKNGLLVFSVNTGVDGKLPTDQIVKAWENQYNVKTDFNDHRVKVTLNGYSDYETNITIDHKIEGDQIGLDALTYSYDDLMATTTNILDNQETENDMILTGTMTAIFISLFGMIFLFLSYSREDAIIWPFLSVVLFSIVVLYSYTIPFSVDASGAVVGTSANVVLSGISLMFLCIALLRAVYISFSFFKR